MITKTTELGQEYFDLFEEIEAKTGIHIENLEQYFGNIQAIKEADMKFLRVPLDEPMLEINANTRKINVESTDFKVNGLSVQGDHIAETVFFKIDRYFDFMDLMNTDISINWKSGSQIGNSVCPIKSDAIVPGYIVFAWPIPKEATEKGGAITFAVQCVIKDGEENVAYSFNTLPANLNIKDGLVLVNPEVYDLTSNIKSILSNSSFGEGNAFVPNVTWVYDLKKDLFNSDFAEVINLRAINNDGELVSEPVYLYALATSGRGTKVDYSDNEKAPLVSCFIEVPADAELNSDVTYYVESAKDETGHATYAVANSDALAAFGTDDAVTLFVEAVEIKADKVGSYYVNAQGIKYDTNDVKIGASGVTACAYVEIPEAATPNTVVITAPTVEIPEGYVIADDSKTVFLTSDSINLTAATDLDDFGLLSFSWMKDGTSVSEGEFAEENEGVLEVSAEGAYKAIAKHYRNGETKTKESEPCLVSQLASKISAELESSDRIDLVKSTGGFTRGASATIAVSYAFDTESPYSEEIKFELETLTGKPAVAVFTKNPDVENTYGCLINSADIAEGDYRIKVSNVYNGSIYSTYTDNIFINVAAAE